MKKCSLPNKYYPVHDITEDELLNINLPFVTFEYNFILDTLTLRQYDSYYFFGKSQDAKTPQKGENKSIECSSFYIRNISEKYIGISEIETIKVVSRSPKYSKYCLPVDIKTLQLVLTNRYTKLLKTYPDYDISVEILMNKFKNRYNMKNMIYFISSSLAALSLDEDDNKPKCNSSLICYIHDYLINVYK